MITYTNDNFWTAGLPESSLFLLKSPLTLTRGGASTSFLNRAARSQLDAKSLNESHPTEVRKLRFLEGETNFLGPLGIQHKIP